MKNIIIASTSTIHGGKYLDYLLPELQSFFSNVKELLFIPYARPSGISQDDYTKKVSEAFTKINISVKGIHEFENPKEAIEKAQGIFTGGGNTFLLVSQLYKNNVIDILEKVVKNGTPYLGTSAGSNICGLTMSTTNDMPIVYPPSFRTLGFVSFNINPHYLDPIEGSTHMGETRETRINEFHHFNPQPVVGVR
jgi:dipeptidase E